MSSITEKKTGKTYWRSLDDLADTARFQEIVRNEFPGFEQELATPRSRRGFLKLMGGSMALAGLTACRWPVEEIVPFADRPDGTTPGIPNHYATAMELGGVSTGLLVTSYDGRPIKVEGNSLHPYSGGATSAMAQGAMLELYDPDRSRKVMRREGEGSWEALDRFFAETAAGLGSGDRFAVLSEAVGSPTLKRIRERLANRYPGMRWVEYEALDRGNEKAGSELAFQARYRPVQDLSAAQVIVSFEDDLLQDHPAAVKNISGFAAGRNPERGHVSRLYVAESAMTLTGSRADHRMAVRSGDVAAIAFAVAAELFLNKGLALPSGFESLRQLLETASGHPAHTGTVKSIADDLAANRGSSLLTAGRRQPAQVHALVHLLNQALGNAGRTVSYLREDDSADRLEDLEGLVSAMIGGQVETLVILGGNPAYNAPADLNFTAALAGVPASIRLGLYEDETSAASTWHVPQAHFLESWSDGRAWDGTVSVIQPLIAPLWSGRSAIEVMAAFEGGAAASGYDLVKAGYDEGSWRQTLHAGLLEGSALPQETPVVGHGWVDDELAGLAAVAPASIALEYVFAADVKLHDGRFAANGWLQELPDPLTKLTWDNAAVMSPVLAARVGVSDGDMVQVMVGGTSMELPVYQMPGQAADSVTLALGYGREFGHPVADGVGFNTYALRRSDTMHTALGTIAAAAGKYTLSSTQDFHAMDDRGAQEMEDRAEQFIREVEADDWFHDPAHAMHGGHKLPDADLWEPPKYDGDHAWAMSIDLNSCVGCAACTIACQAENNIPVVGKDQIARGRDMHWIRVDRYFSGAPENPEVRFQPVACQHCENAPCEQVCPVAATTHDDEGLNVMVYNRCIGTRYCSNNCPFKVRRFNFFNFHRKESGVPEQNYEIANMVHNPEVTVRARGVMEKCTFCLQRISQAKITAKNEGRKLQDGDVVPACQQVCPASAIRFGDLTDENSHVVRQRTDHRAYTMLDDLKVKPRVNYMARLRNTGHGDDPVSGEHS